MSADIDELRRLRRARDRMDREYAQPLDVPALARTALMSPAHFSRRFREAYSETPYSYLMTRRIERAKALLRRGDLSVTDVCFAVGCTSLGSFSARFTELVGETPSTYRARNHDELRVVPTCQTMMLTRPRRGGGQGRAEIEVVLSQPHADRTQEDGDVLAALLAKGELQMVELRSDDLDATFDKIAAAPEAEVLQKPIARPWGARDIAVRDPAGNHVRIEQG